MGDFIFSSEKEDMRRERAVKLAVLCENGSSLLGIAAALNELGYYSLSLCSSVAELIQLLETRTSFEYLVFDNFDFVSDAVHLKVIADYSLVSSVIAISDVNSRQRKNVFQWAWAHQVPLKGVLQAPVRFAELKALIGYDTHTVFTAFPMRFFDVAV